MAIVLACLGHTIAYATPVPAVPAAAELNQQIARLSRSGSTSFEPLLKNWQSRYGTTAIQPLLEIAGATAQYPEPLRYVALMGAARLGGRPTATPITRFLKDRSWLIRSGALRALQNLKDPDTADSVLPLLRDPSLAVRLEAVSATAKLRPSGAAEALIQALGAQDNYHAGKALWVPGRALAALTALRAKGSASQLRPLLDHVRDPSLQIETIATLESLTGRTLRPGASLSERVREWKIALNAPTGQ